jgi:DNA-binding CsgD family transcriptional regulator
MSRSVWTEADRQIVRRMAAEGCSSGVICDAFGGKHPLKRVKGLMHRENLAGIGRPLAQSKRKAADRPAPPVVRKRNRRPAFWADARNAELLQMVAEGTSNRKIGAHFGKTAGAISLQLLALRRKGQGVAARPIGGVRSWSLERCRKLLAQALSKSNAELAIELGMTEKSVASALTRARKLLLAAGEPAPTRLRTAPAPKAKAAPKVAPKAARKPPQPKPAVAPQRGAPRPIPPVHLAKPADADALPCRIRLGGELLNINGTGATRDPAYHWRGTVRQARTLITRNALQGAVIEQLSTGAHGGRA